MHILQYHIIFAKFATYIPKLSLLEPYFILEKSI